MKKSLAIFPMVLIQVSWVSGQISSDELNKVPYSVQMRLAGGDRNKDGSLTLEEDRGHLGLVAQPAKRSGIEPAPKPRIELPPNSKAGDPSPENKTFSAPWVTPSVRATRVQRLTFESAAAKTPVSYHIYTPELYDQDKERRFPVLYWLHGSSGGLPGIKPLSEFFDEAIRKKKMPPALVVFPNGLELSMWCDSKDGRVPMETVVVKELVPHIDKSFRTLATRNGRILEGFSMGGYGAARLGFLYPETFGAISVLAGGPLDLEFQGPRARGNPAGRERILKDTFGGDLEDFKAKSPLTAVSKAAANQAAKPKVRVAVGSRDFTADLNRAFSEHLQKHKFEHDFKLVPGIGHDTMALLKGLGETNWDFYRDSVGKENK